MLSIIRGLVYGELGLHDVGRGRQDKLLDCRRWTRASRRVTGLQTREYGIVEVSSRTCVEHHPRFGLEEPGLPGQLGVRGGGAAMCFPSKTFTIPYSHVRGFHNTILSAELPVGEIHIVELP